jgi:hypothetical protein
MQAAGSPFVGVFPTDRDHPVRVFDAGIPVRWTESPSFSPVSFQGAAHAGENYYFQLGLWAYAASGAREISPAMPQAAPCRPTVVMPLHPPGVVNLTASDGGGLVGPSGMIPLQFVNLEVRTRQKEVPWTPATFSWKFALSCARGQGVQYTGDAFNKTISLATGMVGSLWVGFLVLPATAAGLYTGTITLSSPAAASPVAVDVSIAVDAESVPFGGANNITSLSRLAW